MFEKKLRSFKLYQGSYQNECLVCFKDKSVGANIWDIFYHADPLCEECRKKLHPVEKMIFMDDLECEILYEYNEFFKTLLIQYKELNDEALFPVFLYPFTKEIEKKYSGYTIVFVPSTNQKIQERGFQHLERMFEHVNLTKQSIFLKKETISQKKANYKTRQSVDQFIYLEKGKELNHTPILLVDDVLTTGASLRACYKKIKNHDYPVKALVVSANHSYLED